MRLSDSKNMYTADNTAINIRGIPSTLLMERAAAHVAERAMALRSGDGGAAVFCGSGNNGGDGVAAAYMLMDAGMKVRVFLVGSREKMTPDTAEMERRLISRGGRAEDFDPGDPDMRNYVLSASVIIDAMFGIGLNTQLRGRALQAVELINSSQAPTVAADIASGVEADTGRILGGAVKCDATVTFSRAKPGHFSEPGCTCCGELFVEDIGIPEDLIIASEADVFAVSEQDVSLPVRPRVSHKSGYGRVLIIGGSVGYTGAPVMCAQSAVRSGAGLVHLGVPERIYPIAAAKTLEAMAFPLEGGEDGRLSERAWDEIEKKLSKCDVCAAGPGLGTSDGVRHIIEKLLACGVPLVLDADGLNALSWDMSALKKASGPVVLTPHEGEFSAMGGVLTGDRVGDARSFAVQHGCVLVLKGHRTVTAFPDGQVFINTTGNPGMAKGGSGDVLTGIIAALLGQLPLKQAVVTAVWLHGKAGDLCAEKYGEYSMTPGDMIASLHEVTKRIVR